MSNETVGKKQQRIDESLQEGSLVAFKLYPRDAKLYTGKIIRMGDVQAEVQTANGQKYYVSRYNIKWIKEEGKKWPLHIFRCICGVDYGSKGKPATDEVIEDNELENMENMEDGEDEEWEDCESEQK